jgi:hypothetical protein
MIETNPVSVPFWGGELRVLLPASWLKSLALRGTDFFTVDMYQPDETSVTVTFATNGTSIKQRLDEAFLLSLPWDGGPVSCVSEDGETTGATFARGRAEFALFETGTYTLVEKTEDTPSENMTIAATTGEAVPPTSGPAVFSAPKQEARPGTDGWTTALVIGCACVVSAGVALGFLRKRLVKRS